MMDIRISGWENLPPNGPLILVGNHFSWFEAPLMRVHLPYNAIWLGARELQRNWLFRLLMRLFQAIPVWRGQVDRQALRQGLRVLESNGVLALMPEGGINPELQDMVRRGIPINHIRGIHSRKSAKLMRARSGAGYLALRSKARILSVAFLGLEQVIDSWKRLRRPRVEMRIGHAFGPLTMARGVRGRARKQAMQDAVDNMMLEVAALLPPENRGDYEDASKLQPVVDTEKEMTF